MAHTGTAHRFGSSFIERIKASEKTKVYDLLAATPLIIWYGLCASARFASLSHEMSLTHFSAYDLNSLLSIASQLATLALFGTLIAILILRDRPRAKAEGLIPRIAAIAGTYLSVGIVQLPPVELSDQLYLVSTLLTVIGTLFALYSALNLGQSISMMSEARQLVIRGPYAVIRHPLYLGEGIALAGLTLQFISPTAVLIFVMQCACQVARMNNEERVLARAFPQYSNYMAKTARLIPYLY